MELEQAQQIADTMCDTTRVIEAIKLLRSETSMGLGPAKAYLEQNSDNGQNKTKLLNRLCEDFVQSKQDLLRLAERELKLLTEHIERLKFEIAEEEAQNAQMAGR